MNSFSSAFKKLLGFLLILCLVVTIAYLVVQMYGNIVGDFPSKSDKDESLTEESSSEVLPDTTIKLHIKDYTVGEFGPDQERRDYASGSMTLSIPRLNYTGPVLSVDINQIITAGTAAEIGDDEIDNQLSTAVNELMDDGVVLFNQAQLPGPENRNVSITGHRDYKNMEFMDINTLSTGDVISLIYNNHVYTYQYKETFITNENDWSPIAVQEKSIITLQSCDPPYAENAQYDRIFVVGVLVDIQEFDGSEITQSSSENGLSIDTVG